MNSKERRKFSRVVTENLHLNITLTTPFLDTKTFGITNVSVSCCNNMLL